MNYKQSIRALFEAVINVEVERIEETRRERKDLMRGLIQKRMAQDPRIKGDLAQMGKDPHMDSVKHARNIGVQAGRKLKVAPPGSKGGDVQRDDKGDIKRVSGRPLMSPQARITSIARQHRGKPDVLGKAKADRKARYEKAGAMAAERKRKEREKQPGYISPEKEKENFRRAAKNPRGSDDGSDAARDFEATYGERP